MNIRRIIFKVHECHISLLVIAMKYNNKFITIDYFDESLMKITCFVHNVDIKTVVDQINNVNLQKYWIIVWYDNFVEIAYIDDYTIFTNRFFQNVYYSSNDEDRKVVKKWFRWFNVICFVREIYRIFYIWFRDFVNLRNIF